jgi:hypothetical protein
MPQTCPHCGIALPAVVDAFCPECREDLSATPEEAQQTAQDTFKAVTGSGESDSPEAERTKTAVQAVLYTALAAIASIAGVLERDWWQAIVAGVVCAVCACWVYSMYQGQAVKTTVTGRGKTPRSSEQPK